VNALSPGPVNTKLGLSEKQLNEAASAIEDRVPLHRFGEAGEIAKAALFLASDGSSFMTGSELVVDGGIMGQSYAFPGQRLNAAKLH
jgi:NAD(P)-dependent dehydrogenase (short-subunit alcohol dehydrogenase family)